MSPQPVSASRTVQRLTATSTSSPRRNATRCSAAEPGGQHRRVAARREASSGRSRRSRSARRRPPGSWGGCGASRPRAGARVVHRPAVVRVDQAVVAQFGALVDVGDAGHGQRTSFWPRRHCARARRAGPTRAVSSAATGPSITASSQACTAASNSASGSFHEVCDAGLADRLLGVGVQPVPAARSVTVPSAGHTPKMFCHRNSPVAGSGRRDSAAQRRSTPPTATAPGTAPRCGRARPRRAWCRGWTASSSRAATAAPARRRCDGTRRRSTPNRSGSPPTSLSDTSRASR